MIKKWISVSIGLLLVVAAAGCSAASPAAPAASGQPALNLEGTGSYSANFVIQFSGQTNWQYQVKTRRSPELREISLHIEGAEQANQPGDIRLVTDGSRTWVTGAGTDQSCIEFPNNQGMDPTFITPETLVSLNELKGVLKPAGEETVDGVPLEHFKATGAKTGPWSGATIDIWQAKSGSALAMFTMQAVGEDPFFGAGSGKLSAQYQRGALGSEAISPVTGCEINVPLPDGADGYVRLPGMASFESQTSAAEMTQFYQTILPQEEWSETEPAAQVEGATVLSYQKDTEGVEIHIETAGSGCKVKILWIQAQ